MTQYEIQKKIKAVKEEISHFHDWVRIDQIGLKEIEDSPQIVRERIKKEWHQQIYPPLSKKEMLKEAFTTAPICLYCGEQMIWVD